MPELIDKQKVQTEIALIAKSLARSDAQKAIIGRILFMIDNLPTFEAENDDSSMESPGRCPGTQAQIQIKNEHGGNLKWHGVTTAAERLQTKSANTR